MPSKTSHNWASNIQKHISTAETSATVSTSGVVVSSQASAKPSKQIPNTSSSQSASLQVSMAQQYVIQQSSQHPGAIYAMPLSAMIPGLSPMLDSSQQSKVSETILLKTSSEQVKTVHETPVISHQTIVTSGHSKNEDGLTSSAQPVIQVASSDKSQPSSTSFHGTSTHAAVTVSSSSSSSAIVTSSISGVIMSPYQYYLAAAAGGGSVPGASSVATVVSSTPLTASSTTVAAPSSAVSTTTQSKEKAVTYTVTSSRAPVTSATVSSSTAVVTQPSATVTTPGVMQTQVQYAMVKTGNQQQLYAMPSSAHIQTGFLFFQQPNGMMVAIPAQTVIQPGGSGQVAVAPQAVSAIANGSAGAQQSQQQQQQQQKVPDTSTSGEKSRAKSESEATGEATAKQQKQVYLPVMQQPYELKPLGGKGKRSSSTNVSDDSIHKPSKDQVHSIRHHSASSATSSHTKYQQLYIPRGAHAYRVAAAQAAAAQAASSQQSSTAVVSTSTTTSVTTSSATTLEKTTKESEEASVSNLVPIQVVHQQQYATAVRGDWCGVAQQKQVVAVTNTGSTSLQRKTTAYAAGRPSVLFNATAGTPSSTAQMMLHAVSQGPSGVYEVKVTSLAEIDPVFCKTLTDKYEHDIVKLEHQTAILNKSHDSEKSEDITSEAGDKITKTVSFTSHKDQNRLQTSSLEENVAAIDRTLAAQQTISDDTTTTAASATTANRQTKGRQSKKTAQANEGKNLGASPLNEPTGKQPQGAGARKRKGAKADLGGGQDTAQLPKRKRTPAKKKAAPTAEDVVEDTSKPNKVTPTQRGRKGKAASEGTTKSTLKTAVVSIALDMLVDVPSPADPDEVS